MKNIKSNSYNVTTVNYGESELIKKYSACASYDLAIYILEFIRSNYEKRLPEQDGCQKYVDALNIAIDCIKETIKENN